VEALSMEAALSLQNSRLLVDCNRVNHLFQLKEMAGTIWR